MVNEKYNIFFIYTYNIHWKRGKKEKKENFYERKTNFQSTFMNENENEWMSEWKRKSKEGKTYIKSFSFCLCD